MQLQSIASMTGYWLSCVTWWISIPINCKTGVVHVHSEVGSANQQVHYIIYLDLHWCTWTCSSTHSSVYTDQWHMWCINMGTMETGLEAQSLCVFCLHGPLTDMTHWWHHGSYAEKVKIVKRVGLARPRM